MLDTQLAALLEHLSITVVALGELAKGLRGNVEFTNPKISLPDLILEIDKTRGELRSWRHTLAPREKGL